MATIRGLCRDEAVQGLVEYGLLAVLVALAVVAALYWIGVDLGPVFDRIASCVQAVANGSASLASGC